MKKMKNCGRHLKYTRYNFFKKIKFVYVPLPLQDREEHSRTELVIKLLWVFKRFSSKIFKFCSLCSGQIWSQLSKICTIHTHACFLTYAERFWEEISLISTYYSKFPKVTSVIFFTFFCIAVP